MEYEQLSDRLKKLGISKKKFAEITHQGVTTITNWKSEEKTIPAWVEVFLDNYEKALTYDLIKDKICQIEYDKASVYDLIKEKMCEIEKIKVS